VFAVPRVEPAGNDVAMVQRMIAPDFDPRLVAFSNDATAAGDYPGSARCALRWAEDEPDQVAFEADAPDRAFRGAGRHLLPRLDRDVDGRAAPLFRVNQLTRGIALPAGRHRVTMRYVPEGWRATVRSRAPRCSRGSPLRWRSRCGPRSRAAPGAASQSEPAARTCRRSIALCPRRDFATCAVQAHGEEGALGLRTRLASAGPSTSAHSDMPLAVAHAVHGASDTASHLDGDFLASPPRAMAPVGPPHGPITSVGGSGVGSAHAVATAL
jgi:hypothetical protein